jgi:CRISPR-associated protein Csm3
MANPRPMERVLPGVTFDLEMVYRIFDIAGDGGQKDRDLFDTVVITALALVEADALGSCSSRGCGKVRFEDLKVNGQPIPLPAIQDLLELER